jgi:plasmid stabilization system protein ParE
MKLLLIAEAERDFEETVSYYERREKGLGARFRNEAVELIQWIVRNPEIPRLRPKGYRRVNFHRFSHYLVYVIRGETIWVVALAHAHRRPEFWLERLRLSAPE